MLRKITKLRSNFGHNSSAVKLLSTKVDASDAERPEVIVIGAGVIGASTAYHLAHKGVRPLVLERHKATCGTTWHSAGLFISARADQTDLLITRHTKILAKEILESETGVCPGFTSNGCMTLATNQDRLNELKYKNSFLQ